MAGDFRAWLDRRAEETGRGEHPLASFIANALVVLGVIVLGLAFARWWFGWQA